MYQNIFVTSWSENSPSMCYLWDDVEGLSVTPYNGNFNYAYKLDPNGRFRSMYGERLTKIRRFQRDDPGLYESDLSRETRVLTDTYLHDDTPSTGHKVLCIDIETDSSEGFPRPETAFAEITAIGCYSYADDRYVVFLLDKDDRMPSYETGNRTILSFKTEVELLTAFLEYYGALAPTIMTGWNIDMFDIPYIINRLNRVMGRNSAQLLSPVGLIKFQEQRMRYQIAGVSCIDYLPLYKKFTYSQRPSYRLDAIGQVEIEMGKVEYDGTLDQLYATDINKFIDYNFRDVEIVVGLDKKMKLIELARFICHIGHVPYEDYAYSSKFIEGTIITYLHRKGIIASNKPAGGQAAFEKKQENDEEGFAGAYVKFPFPGVYKWVYSLDLQSLYPSIIMSLNISPDTKCGQVIGWNAEKHMKGKMDYRLEMKDGSKMQFTKQEFDEYMAKWGYNVSSNGILYSTKRVGIIPEILDKWFRERVEYKNTMKKYVKEGNTELADFYDRRQHVQKILLNSIYGVLGLSIFRFYDLDNALAVTASGQDIIKTTAKYINSIYAQRGVPPKSDEWCHEFEAIMKKHKIENFADPSDHCVYIDTDSVYFSAADLMDTEVLQDDSDEGRKKYTITVAREMEGKVNKFYDVLAHKLFYCRKHRLVIKGESVIQSGLWVAKKRYAMKKVFDLETDKDMDKLAVKGLDTVRSSFPPAFSKVMSEIMKGILDGKKKSEIDTIILDFRKNLSKMDYVSIARNTSIKKISERDDPMVNSLDRFPKGATAHQKASIAYNRVLRAYGLDKKFPLIADGDKIKWVYLQKNPYGLDTIAFKGYDDPEVVLSLVEEYIDYDMLFEKELANKLEDFYDALRWGLIPTKVNQNLMAFLME